MDTAKTNIDGNDPNIDKNDLASPNKDLALQILREKKAFCFAGGGACGYSHVGALLELYKLGGLDNITHVVGSSAGSIIAAALACKATCYYIEHIVNTLNPIKFQDGGNVFQKAFRFLYQYGIHKGDAVTQFAAKMLKDLTGSENITFREAYDKYGIHLTITYVSVRYRTVKYLDHITSPDTKIKDGIRWSSGIPLFFKASRSYTPLYRIRDLFCDGGVLNNYAISVLHEQGCSDRDIIGFRLCGDVLLQEYQALEDGRNPNDYDYGVPHNIIDYATGLVDMLRAQALKLHVKEQDWKLTVKIDIGKYTTTDFTIDDYGKQWLLNSGKRSINEHLEDIETLLDKGEYVL